MVVEEEVLLRTVVVVEGVVEGVVEEVDDVETEVGGVELGVMEVVGTVEEVDGTGEEEVLEDVIGSLECEEAGATDVDVGDEVEVVDESKRHQI